jgi:hypothetical protein
MENITLLALGFDVYEIFNNFLHSLPPDEYNYLYPRVSNVNYSGIPEKNSDLLIVNTILGYHHI